MRIFTNYLAGSEYCYTLVRAKIFHMDIDSSMLRSKLKEFFGFDSFKGDQEKIIRHLVSGGSAFVIMPTGGGPSEDSYPAMKESPISSIRPFRGPSLPR